MSVLEGGYGKDVKTAGVSQGSSVVRCVRTCVRVYDFVWRGDVWIMHAQEMAKSQCKKSSGV